MVRNSQTRTPNEYEIDTSKLNAKQARLIEKKSIGNKIDKTRIR
jgi:hypothetical protein